MLPFSKRTKTKTMGSSRSPWYSYFTFFKKRRSKFLKEEIETFNPIGIQGLPRWITSSVKRHEPQTRFGSIVFTIKNEEKRQEILKKKEIVIAGAVIMVVKYLKVSPTTQCTSY